jgi:hypothetical protein
MFRGRMLCHDCRCSISYCGRVIRSNVAALTVHAGGHQVTRPWPRLQASTAAAQPEENGGFHNWEAVVSQVRMSAAAPLLYPAVLLLLSAATMLWLPIQTAFIIGCQRCPRLLRPSSSSVLAVQPNSSSSSTHRLRSIAGGADLLCFSATCAAPVAKFVGASRAALSKHRHSIWQCHCPTCN